jgi:hypothetical protein
LVVQCSTAQKTQKKERRPNLEKQDMSETGVGYSRKERERKMREMEKARMK